MDIKEFFESFPYINASAFAERIGITPSLMRKYKTGKSKPYGKNRELIAQGIAREVEMLSTAIKKAK